MAFEGGGGKGAAYLGALYIFKKIGLLIPTHKGEYVLNKKQIKGISGASAGAITATLLASDFSLTEILKVVSDATILNSFYDAPKVGEVPKVNSTTTFLQKQKGNESQSPNESIKTKVVNKLLNPFRALLWLISKSAPTAVKKILNTDPVGYWQSLTNDLGFFTGEKAVEFIDRKIMSKVPSEIRFSNPDLTRLTFEQHKFIFGNIELKLTGTNLATGKSKYFSWNETPHLYVSDAVRISMSIPFLFKPVRITKDDGILNSQGEIDSDLIGLWVDGGVLNNNPIHAFDEQIGVINPNLLGLRLELDPNPVEVRTLVDLAETFFGTLLNNAEAGQIRTEQERSQTVNLGIGNLSTEEFGASKKDLIQAVKISARAVEDYFHLPPQSKREIEGLIESN